MDFKFELDNLFSRYGLGEVCLENERNDDGIWKTDAYDYVTIKIAAGLKKRFDIFWRNARVKLEERVRAYKVQNGIPFSKGLTMVVTFYFIPVESARQLLLHFHEILPPELNNPDDWEYDHSIENWRREYL
jgi:hypothetical protein